MRTLVNTSRNLIDWLVPQTCLLCDAGSDKALCGPCYRELPWLHHGCEICALPLVSGSWCPQCQAKLPSFDHCTAVFHFTEPLGPLVNQFKRRRNFRNGKVLSAALSTTLKSKDWQTLPDALVPVPLHWRRLLQRGFNQSVFISQEIRARLNIPITPLLRRVAATPKQQGLDRKARLNNLRHAFAINSKRTLPKHVALVDDVMTTGATAEAASRVLKEAGVEQVEVWVLARTPAPHMGAIA